MERQRKAREMQRQGSGKARKRQRKGQRKGQRKTAEGQRKGTGGPRATTDQPLLARGRRLIATNEMACGWIRQGCIISSVPPPCDWHQNPR